MTVSLGFISFFCSNFHHLICVLGSQQLTAYREVSKNDSAICPLMRNYNNINSNSQHYGASIVTPEAGSECHCPRFADDDVDM